jgi:hypothetical protein
LVWVISFLIYTFVIGWVMYFHWILVLPAFCIAAAKIVVEVSTRILEKRKIEKILTFIVISGIGIFGLVSTIILITTNFFPSLFEAAAFVAQNLQGNSHAAGKNSNNNNNDDVTIISSPIYSWIFKYVFDKTHVFHTRDSSQPIKTKKVLLMVDTEYRHVLLKTEVEDEKQIERLKKLYNNTDTIATFASIGVNYDFRKFPYTNIKECPITTVQREYLSIEVKTNY